MMRVELTSHGHPITIKEKDGFCIIELPNEDADDDVPKPILNMRFDSLYEVVDEAVRNSGAGGIKNYRFSEGVPVFEIIIGSQSQTQLGELLSKENSLKWRIKSHIVKRWEIDLQAKPVNSPPDIAIEIVIFLSAQCKDGMHGTPSMEDAEMFRFGTPYILSQSG